MPFAATWMQLEIIVLCEVSQKEKDKYHITLSCFETLVSFKGYLVSSMWFVVVWIDGASGGICKHTCLFCSTRILGSVHTITRVIHRRPAASSLAQPSG